LEILAGDRKERFSEGKTESEQASFQ